MTSHGRYIRSILFEIAADDGVSQRHLASRVGIALGLTNLLLRRVVAKGWVKIVQVKPNRVRYLLTPSGIAAKARLSREYLESTLEFYCEARERVKERLRALSAELEDVGGKKRIVFCGTGDIAEIAYVSLQETDLDLVAVVDAGRTKPFFGLPVYPPDAATARALKDLCCHRVVVTSVSRAAAWDVPAWLAQCEIPKDRVFWI